MLRYWRGGLVGESNGVKDFVEFVDEEFGVGLEHDGFVAQLEGVSWHRVCRLEGRRCRDWRECRRRCV